MRKSLLIAVFTLAGAVCAAGQAGSGAVEPLLRGPLTSSALVASELRHFMLKHVPPLPNPASAVAWEKQADDLRAHELEVLYHGWPKAWVEAEPDFQKVATIQRKGYRIVKLRYEIVPGFSSTALLYEPEHITGRIPAILDVNGHGDGGKAAQHKQKRCINQARRGILALSLEWFQYGELSGKENEHNDIGLLDLAGANGEGLFYLEMRRGLDYLYNDPRVDRARIGMTGLSSGGWQALLLGSLDPRVGPIVPDAGFSSLTTGIEHPEYSGHAELNAADMRAVADYAQLMAMRAPRPTLLIYNAMDDCCFRADVVKQGVYSDIKWFYALMGSPDNLQWYENQDPGTHNYEIDSREQSYRFFDNAFHLNMSDKEDPDTDTEVESYRDLVVGLPKDNLTIVGLARQMAASIHHEPPPLPDIAWVAQQREQLRKVVRYAPVTVAHAWPIDATHEKGLESRAYRFEFSNGLSATGVLLQSLTRPQDGGTTLLISDKGREAMTVEATDDVDRGRRVLVFEPLLFGENFPEGTKNHSGLSIYAQMLSTIGERPLGIQAAQIEAVARWLHSGLFDGTPTPGAHVPPPSSSPAPLHVSTDGPRSETAAIVAAAIDPELFSGLDAHNAIYSFADVYKEPLTYDEAPELMCLDLYRDFDLNTLNAIAAPVKIDLSAPEPERIFW
jgi:dienelactone hydrolase